MKAAILKEFGAALMIEDMPAPELGTGEVIIDVAAARVLSYANEVFSGQRKLGLALPIVPGIGAVGRVRALGPDATQLRTGEWVYCDPTVRSRDDVIAPDVVLQGWSAFGEGGQRLQRYHHHGSFAEQLRVPTENVFRLGEIAPADAARWSALGIYLVPYGGLCKAGLQAGETLLVSGATGNFGSAGVAMALAMGAGCVIAPGRNRRVLDDLTRRFGSRVRPVLLSGDETQDCEQLQRAAPGPIDCVLDLLPPSASMSAVRAAAMSVRPRGRVVLMGGVGAGGDAGLGLPYPWLMRNSISVHGQFMYEREAVARAIALVRAGLHDLSHTHITTFPLAEINQAVAHAAANGGAFELTVIEP
jgi:alcohol dehydrogenase